MVESGVFGSIDESCQYAKASPNRPGIASGRGPTLSSRRPAIGIMIAVAIASGAISRPVASGLRPRTFWRNSGSSSCEPNIITISRQTTMFEPSGRSDRAGP